MPIRVYPNLEESTPSRTKNKPVVWLCNDSWELPVLLFEFERWLEKNGKKLPKGNYIADIGFKPRSDACGGGGILSVSAMRTLAMVNIEVWFSEYSG
ncbi:MAG: hypothetical protein COB08_013875 [Rhodobacteraceae bacterium]|nr:hypothetical protein [Paracoccaceae bacterium]